MRILKILFIFLLILFPFGELLRIDIGSNIALKPLDITAGAICIVFALLVLLKHIKMPSFRWVYFLFPLAGLFSLLINSVWLGPHAILVSSFYLIRWVSYLFVYFAYLTLDKKSHILLLRLLLVDIMVIVLAGGIQYIFFQNLKPLYPQGWDDHLYRVFSVFLDPNFAGALYVLFSMFLGGIIHTLVKNKRVKKILIGVLLLTILSILMTFSRSALIMFVVSAVVFLLLIGKKKLIAVFIACIIGFILLISPWFNIESINLFREASSKARLDNYGVALKIIQEKPLFGVGFNSYRYAKEANHVQMGWTNLPSHADAGVDNSILFIFATTGVVGLMAYLSLWFYLLKIAWAKYNQDRNIYAIIFISSAAGLLFNSLFINSLFYPAIMLWMWLLAAMVMQKK